ncbi:hypothetical protein VTI28DRAFT_6375 [Corynascus sepedonium]
MEPIQVNAYRQTATTSRSLLGFFLSNKKKGRSTHSDVLSSRPVLLFRLFNTPRPDSIYSRKEQHFTEPLARLGLPIAFLEAHPALAVHATERRRSHFPTHQARPWGAPLPPSVPNSYRCKHSSQRELAGFSGTLRVPLVASIRVDPPFCLLSPILRFAY